MKLKTVQISVSNAIVIKIISTFTCLPLLSSVGNTSRSQFNKLYIVRFDKFGLLH